MTADIALDWFLEDAKRQGLSLSEYERRYGIILEQDSRRPSPAGQQIRRNEVPGGAMTADDLGLAAHKEKRRADARRSARLRWPPPDCE